MTERAAVEAVRHAALWFEPTRAGLRPLLDLMEGARIVLIGEATRGTHEFARVRADLTAALVAERHFNVIAAEADGAAAMRVDQWVRLASLESGPHGPLDDFGFPRWAWRNDIVAQFMQWLRDHNARRAGADRVGFHGLGLLGDALMHETLEDVMDRTARHMGYARAVVWAHNRQAGDARAVDVPGSAKPSLGQLARERHGDAFLVGFTTHAGTVTATRGWNGGPETMELPPSIEGSYERLFHDAALERFIIATSQARNVLSTPRPERALGAVYQQQGDGGREYFRASLADQFDAVVHIDRTTALEPFDRQWSDDRSEKHQSQV